MKKLLFCLTILLSTLVLTHKDAQASHAAGGELTYEHISGNTYRFTFRFFRDCDGISAPTSVPLCVYNKCTNTQLVQLTMPRIIGNIPGTNTPNGTPTSTGCPGFQTSCQNPASTVPGYAEWWYQTTYTFPAVGATCDQWRFNTWIGARNPSTNINGGNFYVEAFLNRLPQVASPINNNSPTFSNAPIPYYCSNQPTTFNNGTIEPDGDSLSLLQ